MSLLGENVRRFCKVNYISQEEFAIRADLDRHTVINIMSDGKYLPRRKTIERIAGAMNVPVESAVSQEIEFSSPEIGENIKELCRRNNMTQSKLAEEAGLQEGTLYRIINGKCRPRQMTLECIAPVFGLTFEELVGYQSK